VDERLKQARRASFLVMVIWLAALCVGLGVLLALLLRDAADADAAGRTQQAQARLAWVCLAMLAGTLVVLAWTVLRYIRFRTARPTRRRPTPHVDAWALAGQRLRLEDAPPLEEEDQEQPGEDEGEGDGGNDGEDQAGRPPRGD